MKRERVVWLRHTHNVTWDTCDNFWMDERRLARWYGDTLYCSLCGRRSGL